MKYKKIILNVREWLSRYWLAEFISYFLAIGGGSIAFYYTHNYYLSGLVVIIGDNAGYYITMFVKEIIKTKSLYGEYNIAYLLKDIKNLSFEFAFPQLVETFIIYPLLVIYFPQLFDNYPVGVFIAMTIAVIIFYVQAIFLYEIRKKYFK